MARCHRTVTDAMPSVEAIAETGRPSSSCITTTARRRGVNASSARHTTTLASRAVSCAFPGSTEGFRSESCRLRTAAFRHWSRLRLTSVLTSQASSLDAPAGMDAGDRAALTNVSCTRSSASSGPVVSRRAKRYKRGWCVSNKVASRLARSSDRASGTSLAIDTLFTPHPDVRHPESVGPPRDILRSRVSAAGRRTTEEGAGRGDIDRLRSAVDDTDGDGERNCRTLQRSAIEGSPSVAGFPTSEPQKSRGAGLYQPNGTTAKSEIRVYIHVRGQVDAIGALCGLPRRVSDGLFQALSDTRCCLAHRCFLRYVSNSNFVSLRSALRFCCDKSARSFIANAVSAKSGISALSK